MDVGYWWLETTIDLPETDERLIALEVELRPKLQALMDRMRPDYQAFRALEHEYRRVRLGMSKRQTGMYKPKAP